VVPAAPTHHCRRDSHTQPHTTPRPAPPRERTNEKTTHRLLEPPGGGAQQGKKKIVDHSGDVGPGSYVAADRNLPTQRSQCGAGHAPEHARASAAFRVRERKDVFLDSWVTVSANGCGRRNSHGQ
jgi:hypothetical protein